MVSPKTPVICVLIILVAGQSCSYHRTPATREISIVEQIYIPAAGCDEGEPISNFELPLKNAARPACVSRGKPSLLPAGHAAPNEGISLEVGTVIVMGVSREQVILAADSRSGVLQLQEGRVSFLRTEDQRCKLVELGSTLLFAAAGATKTNQALPANVYYDSQELAREAVRNYVFDPAWDSQNETIRAIAVKWAWDVAFRIRRGLVAGWYRPLGPTWVTGVFAGLEPNGEISVAVAKLEYHQARPGMIVPSVSISVLVPVLPGDFTWVEAFGRDQVAEKYLTRQLVTADTKAEHERIRAEQLRSPREFSERPVERLVELTFEKDPLRYPDGSKLVGGKIDVARLSKHGRVEWLRRKRECFSTTFQ